MYHRLRALDDVGDGVAAVPKVFQPILLVPTLCDLLGTTLAGIGLLYVYPSVWQMLRGSIIIFTGFFSVFFLRRRLLPFRWLGMIITFAGLLMVGAAALLEIKDEKGDANSHTKSQTMLGIVLIVGAQIVSAGQFVIEERFLKQRKFPPLQVVGMEGVFGATIMAAVRGMRTLPQSRVQSLGLMSVCFADCAAHAVLCTGQPGVIAAARELREQLGRVGHDHTQPPSAGGTGPNENANGGASHPH